MESKVCVICDTEKSFDTFTMNIENVNPVFLKEI